jgi:hypothetical protein
MNYKEKREFHKKKLKDVEWKIKCILLTHPHLRELEYQNNLIRFVWEEIGEVKAGSILTLARKILRENPEMDTKRNKEERANAETAHKEYAREAKKTLF